MTNKARFGPIKIIVATTTLLLAGCDMPTDAERAQDACSGITKWSVHEACMAQYVNTLAAGRQAQWEAIGAGLASQPYRRTSSCLAIGGIVTCQ